MEYICFDVETTGLSCKTDFIIEIGAWHIVDSVPVRKFSELVKPPIYVPDFIRRKTGITNSMLVDARTIEEVLPEFYTFCGTLPLVGYNVGFDYGMVTEKLRNMGLDFTLGKQRLGADAYKYAKKYLSKLPSKKLEDVAKYLGIDREKLVHGSNMRGFHSADFDSYVTKLVLDSFINSGIVIEFDLLDKKDDTVYGEAINDNVLPLF